jgi:hypothetical protein
MQLNGVGPLALQWANLLEQLTVRLDLHLLTLHWWVGNLSSRGHLRGAPAWCPLCYAEWQAKERPIYQPLLWMVTVVTRCPIHQQALTSHCPHCQKKQAVIALKTAPGHCTQCKRWLGILGIEKGPLGSVSTPPDWHDFVVAALSELRLASLSGGVLQWELFFLHLAAGIQAVAQRVTQKELELFFTNIASLWQLDQWLSFRWVPSLETILKCCYLCEVTPLELMKGEIFPLVEAIQRGSPSRPAFHRRRKQRVNPGPCLELIQAVLDGREELLGLRRLSERLGCAVPTLLRLYPEECALITQQARAYRRQQKEFRIAQACECVRQQVIALHAQGVYPSLHKVSALLPTGNLRSPEERNTWHATLRELGIES